MSEPLPPIIPSGARRVYVLTASMTPIGQDAVALCRSRRVGRRPETGQGSGLGKPTVAPVQLCQASRSLGEVLP